MPKKSRSWSSQRKIFGDTIDIHAVADAQVLDIFDNLVDVGEGVSLLYNSRKHKDGLFYELLKVAFPDADPKQGEKVEHLRKFQGAGYFLVDATDTPVNTLLAPERTTILRASVGPRVAEPAGIATTPAASRPASARPRARASPCGWTSA